MNYSSKASITIEAPIEKVWEALTEPKYVKQYLFGTNLVTDWKIGSPVYFRGEWEGAPYEDKGYVTSFEPPKTLSYDYWSAFSGIEDKRELYQTVRFDLAETPDGTSVTVTQSNVDTQKRADDNIKNWSTVLEGLKQLLER